ncbi:MAG TPA: spore coat U domain-containing protein [Terriglobia bacterium]|nr:spore coat U domain-containing protein [Terriglobia bacterium]
MTRRTSFIAVVIWLYFAAPAYAAPYQCTLQSASIAFGSYSSAQNTDAIGNISVYCNGKGGIALRISTGRSGTYSNRTLTGSGGVLNYNLYIDSSLTTVWGDKTNGTQQVTGTAKSAGILNFPVYGRIPSGQTAALVGNYTDSLIVTWADDAKLHNFDRSGPMSATASIVAKCTLSVGPLNFGNLGFSLATTSSSQTATVSYTCSRGTTAQITMDQGLNGTGTPASPVRRMKSAANFMGYQLYSNSGMTVVWDGVTGINVTGTGAAQNTTVYGQVPRQTLPPLGTYNDTVVVTINF